MKKRTTFYYFLILNLLLAFSLRSQTYNVPEILYYKFNNGSTTTPNYAAPGQGLDTAVLLGGQTCGQTGQFDSALVGVGGVSTSTYVNTGWNMNLGTSSWTISLWINNIPTSGTNYIFGNDITTSFRCFTNGAAGTGNITLRANNFNNVNVTGVLPGPSVIHFVYDSANTTVKTYVNGVFQSSVSQTPLNLTASVVFKVGGYGTASAIGAGWLVDEFRFYNRALDSLEIAETWNHELPYTVTGVINVNNEFASKYKLEQNNPNPFNPSTSILYSIPEGSNVELKVFDIIGREVQALVNHYQNAGNYIITFDGSSLPSGVYIYRLSAGSFTETKKMILIK
jgi:hypothetical protein